MLGFILKKVISRLLFPLTLSLLALVVGLVLLCLGRGRQRLGLVLACLGVLVLLASVYGVPAHAVMRRLEWQYAPTAGRGMTVPPGGGAERGLWVVVLGSGLSLDAELPANTRLDPHFLARLVEGVRLWRQSAGATLLLSLPGSLSPERKRDFADELCHTLGVDPARVELITAARDTVDEARLTAARVGQAPLLLVTSASHMPRSMRLFQGAGLAPRACPTDYLTARPGTALEIGPTSFYPAAERAVLSERTVYECLGLAWTMLRGQGARPPPHAAGPPK